MLQAGVPTSKYQIHLKSTNGSICVLLVNRDSSNDQPVVVSVPPADSQNNNEIVGESQDGIKSNIKMTQKDRANSEAITDITEPSGNAIALYLETLLIV